MLFNGDSKTMVIKSSNFVVYVYISDTRNFFIRITLYFLFWKYGKSWKKGLQTVKLLNEKVY